MSQNEAAELPGTNPAPAAEIDCGEDVCMKKILDRKALAKDIVAHNRLNNWIPPFAIFAQWLIIAATIATPN